MTSLTVFHKRDAANRVFCLTDFVLRSADCQPVAASSLPAAIDFIVSPHRKIFSASCREEQAGSLHPPSNRGGRATPVALSATPMVASAPHPPARLTVLPRAPSDARDSEQRHRQIVERVVERGLHFANRAIGRNQIPSPKGKPISGSRARMNSAPSTKSSASRTSRRSARNSRSKERSRMTWRGSSGTAQPFVARGKTLADLTRQFWTARGASAQAAKGKGPLRRTRLAETD